jgi:hypothetical protein
MRVSRFVLATLLVFASSLDLSSQQTTAILQRDAQAATLLRQAIAAMGASLPSDSTATGNVTITAGGETSQGSVKVLTRGTNQTSIQFQSTMANWSVIYSNGLASRIDATGTTALPLELAASSQCLYFPQPFLSGLINNPDVSLQYVGEETLDSSEVNHIRAWNTFSSVAQMQFLSDFTLTDIWLDAMSGHPRQISLTRRYGGGSSPKISVSVSYANYQSMSGVQYPLAIQESINGTPWGTTTIQTVTFNTGLSDTAFPVAVEGN